MCKDVIVFVSVSPTCQQTTYIPRPPFGFLQPITPPMTIWRTLLRTLSLDYLHKDKQLLWLWWINSQMEHILECYLLQPPKARLQSFSLRWLAHFTVKHYLRLDPIYQLVLADSIPPQWNEVTDEYNLSSTNWRTNWGFKSFATTASLLICSWKTHRLPQVFTLSRVEIQHVYTQLPRLSPFQVVYGRTSPTISSYSGVQLI